MFDLFHVDKMKINKKRPGLAHFFKKTEHQLTAKHFQIEHDVSLHVLEFGVRLYCRNSGKQVLYYPYPKVSVIKSVTRLGNLLHFG